MLHREPGPIPSENVKPAVIQNEDRRKLVTPLERLMRDVSIDRLYSFLQTMGIRHSVVGGTKGLLDGNENRYKFEGRVFVQGHGPSGGIETLRFYERSAASAGDALRGAVCDFLVMEDFDYHDYRRGEVCDSLDDDV